MVRDETELEEVRQKLTGTYGIELIPGFRCDFTIRSGTAFKWWICTMNRLSGYSPIRKCRRPGSPFGRRADRISPKRVDDVRLFGAWRHSRNDRAGR